MKLFDDVHLMTNCWDRKADSSTMCRSTWNFKKQFDNTILIANEHRESVLIQTDVRFWFWFLPPKGICIDLSYSSLEVKGWGMSDILYFAAVFTRLSDIITFGIFVSDLPFFFSFVSSSTFFKSLLRMFNIFVLTPLAPGPAQSPHPALTVKNKN